MAIKRMSCKKCGEPFISRNMLQKVLGAAKEKGLDRFQSRFELCQKCRAEAFAAEVIETRLEQVQRVRQELTRFTAGEHLLRMGMVYYIPPVNGG